MRWTLARPRNAGRRRREEATKMKVVGREWSFVEEPRQRAAGMQNIACKDRVSHIGLTAANTFVTVERTLSTRISVILHET